MAGFCPQSAWEGFAVDSHGAGMGLHRAHEPPRGFSSLSLQLFQNPPFFLILFFLLFPFTKMVT